MKSLLLILPFSLIVLGAQAQNMYPLVEHFTNTYCSLCPGGNANLRPVLDSNQMTVHHISYHPSVPYSQCSFYQANTAGNGARQQLYTIQFTPQAYLNGVRSGIGGSMLSQTQVDTALAQVPAVGLNVIETDLGAGQVRVDVAINWLSSLPSGDYRLFVAMVEKSINFNAPNGEQVHHDVFRTMLPDNQGELLVPAGPGQQQGFTYTVTLDPTWHAAEMYAVAFIQEMGSLEIFNSGTKFDASATSINGSLESTHLSLYPNPARDRVRLEWSGPELNSASVSVLDAQGRQVMPTRPFATGQELELQDLAAGIYLVKVESSKGLAFKKLLIL